MQPISQITLMISDSTPEQARESLENCKAPFMDYLVTGYLPKFKSSSEILDGLGKVFTKLSNVKISNSKVVIDDTTGQVRVFITIASCKYPDVTVETVVFAVANSAFK